MAHRRRLRCVGGVLEVCSATAASEARMESTAQLAPSVASAAWSAVGSISGVSGAVRASGAGAVGVGGIQRVCGVWASGASAARSASQGRPWHVGGVCSATAASEARLARRGRPPRGWRQRHRRVRDVLDAVGASRGSAALWRRPWGLRRGRRGPLRRRRAELGFTGTSAQRFRESELSPHPGSPEARDQMEERKSAGFGKENNLQRQVNARTEACTIWSTEAVSS
uniref:uncharacterized protein LOC128929115 n=1 Tax=Callithrix jacchus TaxID=9483 RepID=UPI0023DD6470|nr:uncharacterized protein LOC128929115 [Callithrix jacchus]